MESIAPSQAAAPERAERPGAGRQVRRVAIIHTYFPHYRAAILERLARDPRRECTFFADWDTYEQPGVKRWEPPPGVRFERTRVRPLVAGFLWQRGALRLAARGRYDAIIFLGNPYHVSTWLATILARLRGIRVLYWTMGWRRRDTWLKSRVRGWFMGLPHGLLLYGHHAKQAAIRQGFAPERLHVIYNSLDYSRQCQLREEVEPGELEAIRARLFAEPNLPMVICTSRLMPRRRLDLLLQAAGRLERQGHKLNVLLVGDGAARAQLEAQGQELGVRVHFYGACYDEAVLARLTMASTVTAVPGMIGLTVVQSMTYGVPVISHDNPYEQGPEFEAIIPGQNGDLFRQDDLESLTEVLRRWTTQARVPDSVRACCIRMVERFYTPQVQHLLIDRALEGKDANDLFWLEDPPHAIDPPQSES